MAKIRMEYNVPDGGQCVHQFEDKVVVKPCKFLFRDNWCTLFGASPTIIIDGHSIMRTKLYACRHAVVEEPNPQGRPANQAQDPAAGPSEEDAEASQELP